MPPTPAAARRTLTAVLALLGLACAGTGAASRKVPPMPTPPPACRISITCCSASAISSRGSTSSRRSTGVRAVFGGAHPGRGTQNALIALGGDHYLEILGRTPPRWGIRTPPSSRPDAHPHRLGGALPRSGGAAAEPARGGDRGRRDPPRRTQPAGRLAPRLADPGLHPAGEPAAAVLHRVGEGECPSVDDLAGRLPPGRLRARRSDGRRAPQDPAGCRFGSGGETAEVQPVLTSPCCPKGTVEFP